MISYLLGTPVAHGEDLTVVVNGVGYAVHVDSATAVSALNQTQVALFIYTHVREDRIELYGFQSLEAKKLFLLLLDVSGVGPSTALSITSHGPEALVDAVQQADLKFFGSIPRVGKKLAQKIIIDLKSKLGSLKELDLKPLDSKQADVVAALTSLGFGETEAGELVRSLELDKMTVEQAIKEAMRRLG